MDLNCLEQWQLLTWLLYRKTLRPPAEAECASLHHLLMERIGENYQQVICEPPVDSVKNIVVNISPDMLEVIDADDTIVLWHVRQADIDIAVPPGLLLHNRIMAVTPQHSGYIAALRERHFESLTQLPLTSPQPLVVTSAKSGVISSKWKKFRRDPALFFRDFWLKLRK